MKEAYVDLKIRCDCGNTCSAAQDLDGQTPILKELRFLCSACGTGFFIHIQEIRPKNIASCVGQVKRV